MSLWQTKVQAEAANAEEAADAVAQQDADARRSASAGALAARGERKGSEILLISFCLERDW